MSIRLPSHGDEPGFGSATPSLYNLIYCSRAAEGVDAKEVDRIIETSQRENPARGITGLLVFGSGIFFQWLEGPPASVLELMALIRSDDRHHSILMLNPGEAVDERMFGDWAMELVSSEDIRTVLLDALNETDSPASAKSLRDMLEQLEMAELGEEIDRG